MLYTALLVEADNRFKNNGSKKNLDILLFEIKNKAFFYFYDILSCDPVGKQRTKEVG